MKRKEEGPPETLISNGPETNNPASQTADPQTPLWLAFTERSRLNMTCHSCQIACKRFGRHRNGLQRFRCTQCGKTLTEDHTRPLDDMRSEEHTSELQSLRHLV